LGQLEKGDASGFDEDDASDFEVDDIEDNFNESQIVLKFSGLQRQTKMGQYLEKDLKSTLLALRHQALMDRRNTATPLDSAKCPGVTWRHGKFPCPYSDKLTEIQWHNSGKTAFASTTGALHATYVNPSWQRLGTG
jgi:hypothetical protein